MQTSCFHCGLPALEQYSAIVDGQQRDFCCTGCQAVALAIVEGGLGDFYQFRDSTNQKVKEESQAYVEYDLDAIQEDLLTPLSNHTYSVKFYLESISCAACAWLIESYLARSNAVSRVAVNATTQICTIEWDKSALRLSALMHMLESIGYSPRPASSQAAAEGARNIQRNHLMRLGVAGIGMMQVGMVAVALYAGGLQGIESGWQGFLRWVSFIFATPVILYSAQPFFFSAWRALKLKSLNMDVPVCIALVLAYGASIYATVTHSGEVYFDSVSMFTFFLLLGRYLEMRARNNNQIKSQHFLSLLPITAQKQIDNTLVVVPLKSVEVGDVLYVEAGAVFPVDGTVLTGTTTADESLLTGESTPVHKGKGSEVIAGAVNGDTAVTVRVTATGDATALSVIENLVDDAQQQKPAQVAFADKIAGRFVALVLVISCLVGGAWLWVDASRALWVVLSVLVITCPCALSLATPAALTAGTSRLRELGFLVRSKHVLETLAKTNHVVFDKTGTLTAGQFSIEKVLCMREGVSEGNVLTLLAALEAHSRHPIASAFKHIPFLEPATSVSVVAGLGIEGEWMGANYKFGKMAFAAPGAQGPLPEGIADGVAGDAAGDVDRDSVSESIKQPSEASAGIWQCLADANGIVAWVYLSDSIRPETKSVLETLRAQNKRTTLLSGDRQENVDLFSRKLTLDYCAGDQLPQHKLAYVTNRQAQGDTILMVGDGINDAPVLSGADISVAMPKATELAQIKSDALLLNDNLNTLVQALAVSQSVQLIIRQNLAWALLYNALALPAAALGLIPPYLAAAGMSLSSLVVVLNSFRVARERPVLQPVN